MGDPLPVGKLPANLLRSILAQAPQADPRLLLGPRVGFDCAVLDFGERLLVLKSDPITFATRSIGWYLVQVNSNDIATTGASPRWLLVTALLPERSTTAGLIEEIASQVFEACETLGISVIGGHTEITHGLDRPILAGTLIGEVNRGKLITPRGMSVGDRVLLAKGVPIEATSILANEFPDRLTGVLSQEELLQARNYLHDPGISILRDAQIARAAGRVTAMHDPTEGGLLTALWELAEAGNKRLEIDLKAVPIPPLSKRICDAFELNPLAIIASGALLLTCSADDAPSIITALDESGIPCATIGRVEEGPFAALNMDTGGLLPRPDQDEIGRVYKTYSAD
ncbi:MAG: AIR synthase family protein [Candidatus Promineifilaceae bacterium]|jgi:hydrogenase expression/formation protein HypE